MPKYTKLPQISNPHWVQKAHPLISLSKSDLTLTSLKILDAYLDKINIRNPEERTVIFNREEIETLLGTRINHKDMDKRLKALLQAVDLSDNNHRHIIQLNLFEYAEAICDDNDEWVMVWLKCTPTAMQFFFDGDNFTYFKYKLHNVIRLKSRYSYFLFLYLVQNQFRRTWDVSLQELKDIINANLPSYDKFHRFNQLILSPAAAEINELTDLKFEYQPIRSGRSTTGIRFFITRGIEYPEEEKLPEKETPISNLIESTDCSLEDAIPKPFESPRSFFDNDPFGLKTISNVEVDNDIIGIY